MMERLQNLHNPTPFRKLLKAVEEDLPRFNHVTVPETVEEWLTEIDLSRYLPRFNTNRMGEQNYPEFIASTRQMCYNANG